MRAPAPKIRHGRPRQKCFWPALVKGKIAFGQKRTSREWTKNGKYATHTHTTNAKMREEERREGEEERRAEDEGAKKEEQGEEAVTENSPEKVRRSKRARKQVAFTDFSVADSDSDQDEQGGPSTTIQKNQKKTKKKQLLQQQKE